MPTREVYIGYSLLLGLCLAGTYVTYSRRRALRGITDIRWAIIGGLVGVFCLLLRGIAPLPVVAVGGQSAMLVGFAFLHRALARAIDRPARLVPFFPILFLAFVGFLTYFSIGQNSLDGRLTVASLGVAIMLAWTVSLAAQPVKPGLLVPMRWMYRLLLLAVALRVIRVPITLIFDPGPNLTVFDPIQGLMVYILVLAAMAQAAGTVWIAICAQQEADRTRADTDGLTGLLNRRAFEEALTQRLAQPCSHGSEISLVLVDLDFFKGMNDDFGHLAGDTVLQRVSAVLRRSVRNGDVLARFGGDEFAVLLCSAEAGQGMVVAERIRQSLIHMKNLPGGRKVTASLGVATSMPGDTPLMLIERADRALYHSKNLGRNRLSRFGDEDDAAAGDDSLASALIQ
ncbi:MAG: diguanylate cyclase [Acidobacteriaceae bacterium]